MQKYCPQPGCSQPMHHVNKNGVTVDQCPVDGTLVFDPGEFEMAIAAITTNPHFRARNPHEMRQRVSHHYSGHGYGYGHRHSNSGGFFEVFFDPSS